MDRINKGIEEINEEPVIFRWKYKMEEKEDKNDWYDILSQERTTNVRVKNFLFMIEKI